jgi:hypothetical protein
MKSKTGWALIAVLISFASLTVMVLTAACFSMLELRQLEQVAFRHRLHDASISAAARACGELQAFLGRDAVLTATDAEGKTVFRAPGSREPVRLDGLFSDGSLAWNWTVEDLSQGYDVAAAYGAAERASAWAKTSAGRQKLPSALPVLPMSAAARLAWQMGDRDMFNWQTGRNVSPGISWQTRGLMTDPVAGGFRKDLARPEVLAGEWGAAWSTWLASDALKVEPCRGVPMFLWEAGTQVASHLPVLADFRLSLGFFNSRSDGRHRLRFHGSGLLWNPSTMPMLAGPQGRIFLVEVDGAPTVTVTNRETGSTFTVDLDDCPQESFGIIRQGAREKSLWFWAEVADPLTYGMSGRGLLGGECFAFINPTPEAQPQGLSRILTTMTWRMDTRPHTASWRRPDPETFLATDRIELLVQFHSKVTVRLRPAAGDPDKEKPIADYPSAPVITFDNISLPDFGIQTTGADYSREDSAGYVIGERRACLRFRLKPRTAMDFWERAEVGGLTKTRWDFDDPADAAEWMVDHPVRAAFDVSDVDATPLAGLLWDAVPNKHQAEGSVAFASVNAREVPLWPYLSAAWSRHWEPRAGRRWLGRLDGYFCSAPLKSAESGVVSHNPFLSTWRGWEFADDPGSRWSIEGPFNVNSRSVAAWEAFLRGAIGSWAADTGGPYPAGKLSDGLFFTRPSGAALAKWGALTGVDVTDAQAAALGGVEHDALMAAQSVRRLDSSALHQLAVKMVELQPACGYPFPSLKDFAVSGLLEQAMEACRINGVVGAVPVGAPFRLAAADLLEAWAPILTVRGDTFRIIGTATGQGVAASCVCEWVVQRVPDEHPVRLLGRRFRIISVRFRNY